MRLSEALTRLKTLGNESVRKRNARNGAGDDQFGVQLGDIRKLAKEIEADHELGLALWATKNFDARLLAILLLTPAKLSAKELDSMVKAATSMQLAEWLTAYVLKKHPGKEALRVKWMKSKDPGTARAGWGLTAERVAKSPEGLDLPALLDRIESEMAGAHPATQWTMNACLATIGIHSKALRKHALAIGESLGVYRDYPVSKGCTSPFAPIWIREMVRRQGRAAPRARQRPSAGRPPARWSGRSGRRRSPPAAATSRSRSG